MEKLTLERLNNKSYLVGRVPEGCAVDEDCLATISEGKADEEREGFVGVVPVIYSQIFQERTLRYDINAYLPLSEYKSRIVGKEQLANFFLSIIDTCQKAESYLLDPGFFLLEEEYVYVNEATGKACLIMYPVVGMGSNGDLRQLFGRMMNGIRLIERDMGFYGKVIYELDYAESFSIVKFRELLTSQGLDSRASSYGSLSVGNEDFQESTAPSERLSSGQSAGRPGASSEQSAGRSGASSGQSAGRFGTSSGQPAGRFGTSSEQPAGRFGASSEQSAGRSGASSGQSARRFGASSGQSAGRFGASSGQFEGTSQGGLTAPGKCVSGGQDDFPDLQGGRQEKEVKAKKKGGGLGGLFGGAGRKDRQSKGNDSGERTSGEKTVKEMSADGKPTREKPPREKSSREKPSRGKSPQGASGLFALPDEEVGVSPREAKSKTAAHGPGREEPLLAEIPKTADEDIFASYARTADEEEETDAVGKKTLELFYLNEKKMIRVTSFPFEIGREGKGCRIDPSKGKVSRRHAVLRWDGERFQICDVSKLGTALNGERLPRDIFVDLEDGMRIDLKGEIFEVRILEG